MLEYLPLPYKLSVLEETQGGFQFIVDAPYTRQILKWLLKIIRIFFVYNHQLFRWYLCAMTEDCIAPQDANLSCNKNITERYRTYMNASFSYFSAAVAKILLAYEKNICIRQLF